MDPTLVFKNCDTLLSDEDEFVQKSVGWLLKVTAAHHEEAVVDYLKQNIFIMQRGTIRYAIEKMDKSTKSMIIAL